MRNITGNNFTGTAVEPRYQRDDTPTIAAVTEPAVRTNDAKTVSHVALQQDINHGTATDPTQDSPDEAETEQPQLKER